MKVELLKKFTLLLLSICFVCVVLEIAVRFYFGNHLVFLWPQAMHIRTEYGYKLKPNQKNSFTLDKPVYTNSFGFRDGEWKQPKGSGVIRIMCLGDSLTFGNAVRVEETYPKVLEKKLRTQFGDCEVITAAVGGWSLYDEYNFLTAEGYKYQPDIIVLGFYIRDL